MDNAATPHKSNGEHTCWAVRCAVRRSVANEGHHALITQARNAIIQIVRADADISKLPCLFFFFFFAITGCKYESYALFHTAIRSPGRHVSNSRGTPRRLSAVFLLPRLLLHPPHTPLAPLAAKAAH